MSTKVTDFLTVYYGRHASVCYCRMRSTKYEKFPTQNVANKKKKKKEKNAQSHLLHPTNSKIKYINMIYFRGTTTGRGSPVVPVRVPTQFSIMMDTPSDELRVLTKKLFYYLFIYFLVIDRPMV